MRILSDFAVWRKLLFNQLAVVSQDNRAVDMQLRVPLTAAATIPCCTCTQANANRGAFYSVFSSEHLSEVQQIFDNSRVVAYMLLLNNYSLTFRVYRIVATWGVISILHLPAVSHPWLDLNYLDLVCLCHRSLFILLNLITTLRLIPFTRARNF